MIISIIQRVIGIGGSAIDLSEGSPWPNICPAYVMTKKTDRLRQRVWEENNGWQLYHSLLIPEALALQGFCSVALTAFTLNAPMARPRVLAVLIS